MKARFWTKYKVQKLISLYPNKSNREIGEILGVSNKAISSKAKLLGLRKAENYSPLPHNCAERRVDIEKFKAAYPFSSNVSLAKIYNTSENVIKNIAVKYGIIKDPNYRNPGCYPKGHVPANKGKSTNGGPPRYRYKKGNKPKNTLHDGAITLRHPHKNRGSKPYYFIRISEGKWEHLHRELWKHKYGAIPKDKIVAFKDGNTMNCAIENLELITRKENLRRNQQEHLTSGQIAAYMSKSDSLKAELLKLPELIELKTELIKLNRIIRNGKS